jgi:two-component system, chemotaxis family, chemotaxis protein CheY
MKIKVVEIEGIEEGYLAADDIMAFDGTIIVRKGMEIEGKHMRLFKRTAMHQVRVIVPDEKPEKRDGKPLHVNEFPNHKAVLESERIMIVDDSKYVRFKLEKTFSEAGLKVVGSAVDGLEAVKVASEIKPTVITLDIEMPNHDGISAILPLKEAVPGVIIVMISSVDEEDKVLEALNKGANDFTNKPIEPERVIKTVISNILFREIS